MPQLDQALAEQVKRFILDAHAKADIQPAGQTDTHPLWTRLGELGTQLWLDTGDIAEAGEIWTREFSALTTNNSLLNKEVQKGTYDELIPRAADMLGEMGLPGSQQVLEIAFILNAVHGLALVKRYDAYVSVEEHTDLAHDYAGAVDYAQRYYDICPQRFIIKLPLTPAGILATRYLSGEGIPVNHTLGFSARQNYVVARLARPTYVNVFLGRLNSVVADNGLGSGEYVGERATLASQAAIRRLRIEQHIPTGQIGASFRSGDQLAALAGIDVMTFPPKAAEQLLEADPTGESLIDQTGQLYQPGLAENVDAHELKIDTLWDIGEMVHRCTDALAGEDLDAFSAEDLVTFFAENGAGDLLVPWTAEEITTSSEEGKIPKLANWREHLRTGRAGLDAIMNLAGLNAFIADQRAMDDRVRRILQESGSYRGE